ncbi:hypothetical protein HPL003_18095 [Paenibacillus terrae HPL-003]|uniref:Uncharacterized protein n=1 Tax=Paenibacillus terrae (strain HPL-003) TaxID=985665 RepID=G7W2L6_PAETH|nr:hypothetical protein HPL003_18095 [Paenibacillus terrae HPL-003]
MDLILQSLLLFRIQIPCSAAASYKVNTFQEAERE